MQVRYLGLIEHLKQLVVDPALALSAAVYTELADVEAEINGLTTYDRKVRTCTLRSPSWSKQHLKMCRMPLLIFACLVQHV